MAIEDYICSLLLSRCGHALLATGNGLRCWALSGFIAPSMIGSQEDSNPSTQDVGADYSDQLLLPRAFQRMIMLAGAAACRSLGKEKIEEGQWDCVVLGRRFSTPIEELHGYVPDSSLELEHLMQKTQNRGERLGDWWYLRPFPTPARMR